MTPSVPSYCNPMQWHQAQAMSREECARVFRDGGTPADAIATFGMKPEDSATWEKAVDQIANELLVRTLPRAA